jgi:hypothetical protein
MGCVRLTAAPKQFKTERAVGSWLCNPEEGIKNYKGKDGMG